MPHSSQVSPSEVMATTELTAKVETRPCSSKQQQWPLPLIVGALLLAVGAGWFGNGWFTSRAKPNSPASGAMAGQPSAVSVKLMALKTGTLEDSSEVVGTMEAQRSVLLTPEIEGRISEILDLLPHFPLACNTGWPSIGPSLWRSP
jgi:hypothetical protein